MQLSRGTEIRTITVAGGLTETEMAPPERPLRSVAEFARKMAGAMLDFVLPAFCAVCERPLHVGESIVCTACWEGFAESSDDGCPRCGSSLPPSGGRCAACVGSAFSFAGAAVLGAYEGILENLIRLMKYRPMPDLARRLGVRLGARLSAGHRVDACEIVVPVPLHPTKQRERGFSQTSILAREVARWLQLPCSDGILRRIRWTRSQTTLPWDERRENVRGAFGPGRADLPYARKVLLVDDVLTSCATADEASRALLNLGAREVVVGAVARAGVG